MKRTFLLACALAMSCANQDAPLAPAPDAAALTATAPDAAPDAATQDAGDGDAGPSHRKWTVYFSPKGGCTDAIVALIQSAKTEVLVQAYSFTSKPVADALVQKSKKVPVRVVLDSDEHQNASGRAMLLAGGVSFWSDPKHVIAHNKVIIVDEKEVETGSFNYTAQADNGNAENCLIVRDAVLAGQYAANWRLHQGHSVLVSALDAGASNGDGGK